MSTGLKANSDGLTGELQVNGSTVLSAVAAGISIPGTLSVTGAVSPSALLDISGASAGQIKFPATQNASSNANTLDDYEEGTWTPSDVSGAGLSLTVTSAVYTKIGRVVVVQARITWPANANGSTAAVGGLPFTVGAQDYAISVYPNSGTAIGGYIPANDTYCTFQNLVGGAAITNANLSGITLRITGTYFV